MPTNIKENGFETLIVDYLVSQNGYEEGSNEDYNKTYAIDETRLFRFLNTTQKRKMEELRVQELIEGKKMAKNASYFAFTATPKNKTLDMFGQKMFDANGKPILNEDGTQKSKPHYVYTMKQAIY
jgi:hypothetical protein